MNAQGYTVGELADLAGVTVFTLRHYDQLGLLHPSRDAHSRYRHYGPKRRAAARRFGQKDRRQQKLHDNVRHDRKRLHA